MCLSEEHCACWISLLRSGDGSGVRGQGRCRAIVGVKMARRVSLSQKENATFLVLNRLWTILLALNSS